MRRTTIAWLLAIILALATGALLSSSVAVFTAPAPSLVSDDRSSAVVRDFYDAVNVALQTGETASLDALLADDMVEHDPAPGLPPEGRSLIHRVFELRAIAPGMTLVVDEVLASGDFATARVHVTGRGSGVFLGLAVIEDVPSWGPLDQFRIAGGFIAEHWGSATPLTFFEPVRQVSIAEWFAPGELVALERLSLPAHAQLAATIAPDTRLIYLSTGSLTVSIDSQSAAPGLLAATAGSASTDRPVRIAPGDERTLAPGDLLALPKSTRYLLVNAADATAEAVVANRSSDRPSGDTPSYQGTHPNAIESAPDASVADATPPADSTDTERSNMGAAIGLGRATLAPGGMLVLSVITGPVLVTVESGRLDFHVADGTAQLRHGGSGPSEVVIGSDLVVGDDVAAQSSSAISLRNLGSTPATILVAAITSEELPA